MSVDDLGGVLLLGSAVLLLAVVAVRISARSGFPTLLLYFGLGLLIGERGLGIRFDDARLTGVLGYGALLVILAEGGLTTRWSTIRPTVPAAAVLASVGTVISVGVTAVAAHLVLHLDWTTAALLGAVVSSTDAAAVFSLLRRIPLPGRLVGLLEAESGFNDAPAVILVVAFTERAAGGPAHAWWVLLGEAVLELAVGAVVGVAVGWAGVELLRRVALPSSGLYPITVLGLATAAFGAADVLHGSGFLATYLAGLVLGNRRLPHGAAVRGFAEAMGWIAQIGLFVLLGLLADPARLPGRALPAIAVGLVIVLLSRPLSVLLTVSWFRVRMREQAFLDDPARPRPAGVDRDLRRGGRDRRRVHPAPGADSALGRPEPRAGRVGDNGRSRGRVGTAGRPGRRRGDRPGRARLAAARRGDLRAPAARAGERHPRGAGRRGLRADAADHAPAR
jgi:cell volume regulation protein A